MSKELSESRKEGLDEIERSNFAMMDDIKWIIERLKKNIRNLEEELKTVRKMPHPIGTRMSNGISRNLIDRKEDLDDYKRVLHGYETRNKAHRD